MCGALTSISSGNSSSLKKARNLVKEAVRFPPLTSRRGPDRQNLHVKAAGGVWKPNKHVWQLRCDRAIALGLKEGIIEDAGC